MGCILGMLLSFAQLISAPWTIPASIHMTMTACSVCAGRQQLDAKTPAPQTSSELKYYVLLWAFSTGVAMFEEWHDRIHFLGVPDDRRTKIPLGVACTVVPLTVVLYLNDMCRSVPLLNGIIAIMKAAIYRQETIAEQIQRYGRRLPGEPLFNRPGELCAFLWAELIQVRQHLPPWLLKPSTLAAKLHMF